MGAAAAPGTWPVATPPMIGGYEAYEVAASMWHPLAPAPAPSAAKPIATERYKTSMCTNFEKPGARRALCPRTLPRPATARAVTRRPAHAVHPPHPSSQVAAVSAPRVPLRTVRLSFARKEVIRPLLAVSITSALGAIRGHDASAHPTRENRDSIPRAGRRQLARTPLCARGPCELLFLGDIGLSC
eukprot:7327722-Prymnesium_polylepis.1